MKHKEKCLKIRELIYKANGTIEGRPLGGYIKWRTLEDLNEYIGGFGGRVKYDKKRRRGYFVVHLYDDLASLVGLEGVGLKPICAEIPKDFGEKVMVLGGFP